MDRNTIIGGILIMLIMGGLLYINTPSEETKAHNKFLMDSAAKEMARQDSISASKALQAKAADTTFATMSDSALMAIKVGQYGPFAAASEGSSELIRIENDVMVLLLEPKGGKVNQVLLKDFKRYGSSEMLALVDAQKSSYKMPLNVGTRVFSTDSLYFTTDVKSTTVTGESVLTVPMRLYAGAPDKYIEFLYTVKGNDYMVGFDVNFVGMQGVLNQNSPVKLEWTQLAPRQEKDPKNEKSKSTIYYKEANGDVDNLGFGSDDDEITDEPIQWLAFSQQFFTSTLISEKPIDKPIELKTAQTTDGDSSAVRTYSAVITLRANGSGNESIKMQWYFGPKDYKILKKYDMDLEEQISLGVWIFRYVNTWVIINLFQWLDGFNLSYGLIILILTLVIKLALSPITYKTYLSSAKMRVLKPDIDAINEKFKDADAMKKQQETMALYRKAGVNPLAGCIPALLQMPILFAIFQFFPSSIELRGQSFLWADDLSSWDSIATLPFHIPFYGNHVSLFTLLMTASTLLYTMTTQTNMGTGAQAKQMKIMMYLMPILFLGVLNSSSAALSYYYFLANTITIAQTYIIRKFVVNEEKLRAKIEDNKKRPQKPKKGWQAKLEEMQKVQQQRAEELKKKSKK